MTRQGNGQGAIVTLEPLLGAVREGIEGAGWGLSGLQKTTSVEFEGRWRGESARSAYLFFHREELAEWASIDVFLNETPRTLRGNIALAIDAPALGEARELRPLLSTLSRTARETLLEGYETPVILRLRLPDGAAGPEEAEMEYRFKIRIPGAALEAGSSAIVALAGAVVGAFEELLEHPSLRHHLRDR